MGQEMLAEDSRERGMSNDSVINFVREPFLGRCARVLRNDGLGGFTKRGFQKLLGTLEPLKTIFYPYVLWKLPREVEADYIAEEAVDFALNRFGGFLRPTQVTSEILGLGNIIERLKPRTVLEIGTSKGGTLFIWARLAAKDAHLVSVDLPGGENNWAYPRWKEPLYRKFASKMQTIDLLRGNSHSEEMLAAVKEVLHGKDLDFLFIDGDHSYEGVRSDFLLYRSLVRKGGLIAFHDIVVGLPENVGGVPVFWREIKREYRHTELIKDPRQGGYGIGILYVE